MLTAVFGSTWAVIVGAALALGGILFGFFKGKAADARAAKAGQEAAEAHANAAQAQTQVAEVRDAEAQANAVAAQAGAQSSKERINVENDIAALSGGAAQQQLRDDWGRPDETVGGTAAGSGPDANR